MTGIAIGLIGAAGAAFAYVGWQIYRGAKAVLEDPDSADLFDGRDSR